MNVKRLAMAALAVNTILATPTMADDRAECESGMVHWLFNTDLIPSVIRLDRGYAIAVNESLLAKLPPMVQTHILRCVEILSDAESPEEWPPAPDEEI